MSLHRSAREPSRAPVCAARGTRGEPGRSRSREYSGAYAFATGIGITIRNGFNARTTTQGVPRASGVALVLVSKGDEGATMKTILTTMTGRTSSRCYGRKPRRTFMIRIAATICCLALSGALVSPAVRRTHQETRTTGSQSDQQGDEQGAADVEGEESPLEPAGQRRRGTPPGYGGRQYEQARAPGYSPRSESAQPRHLQQAPQQEARALSRPGRVGGRLTAFAISSGVSSSSRSSSGLRPVRKQ